MNIRDVVLELEKLGSDEDPVYWGRYLTSPKQMYFAGLEKAPYIPAGGLHIKYHDRKGRIIEGSLIDLLIDREGEQAKPSYYDLTEMVHHLAIAVMDGDDSGNAKDYAHDCWETVLPYLGLGSE